MKSGAYAEGVRGVVLPTVTYPSHTTLITGVWPSKHGIWNNVAFDPFGINPEGRYWYTQDIRVQTQWDAAASAHLTVGSVSWPVSVGARSVQYLIPEVWRAVTPDDLKLLRTLPTPGLLSEFEPVLGPYVSNIDAGTAGDWSRTRYAEPIIREKHVRLKTSMPHSQSISNWVSRRAMRSPVRWFAASIPAALTAARRLIPKCALRFS